MRHFLIAGAALAVALLGTSLAAQEPGDKIMARTAKDIELLLPQNGIGGTDKLQLESLEPVVKDMKIEVEGCDKGKAHIALPAGMDRNRKHALVISFNGGLEAGKAMTDISKIGGGKDPLLFCALTYSKMTEVSENSFTFERLIDRDAIGAGYSWLLKKVQADYPVDPERIFILGEDGGSGDALEFAKELWMADPDAFPARAVLLDGVVGESYSPSFPPVPYIVSVDTLFGNRRSGWVEEIRKFVNDMRSNGLPAQYHEYRGSLTGTAPRRMFILRDAIATLGGPGVPDYPKERPMPGVIVEADKLPWTVDNTADLNIRQVVAFLEQGQWADARERLESLLGGKMSSKEKREMKSFQKDFEKYAKNEIDRCHASVEMSLKADVWPHHLHHSRLKALCNAFKDERWVQGKKYGETLAALKTFGPAVRDEERKQQMLKAEKLELEGKREEAKKIYETLASQQKEDGGVSDWPFAAEYRLSWWKE
jgi:hypothetical protein